MDLEIAATYELVSLELRQEGGRPTIVGRFPYSGMAVMRATGHVRKERVAPGAFRYAIEAPDREINLLSGHSFDRPLASKLRGTLTFDDSPDALSFRAVLPTVDRQPTYMRDTILGIEEGLQAQLSPGFVVPPASTVPGAERIDLEPGTGVGIRTIVEAVLLEMSVVTRAAYSEAAVALRHLEGGATLHPATLAQRVGLWL